MNQDKFKEIYAESRNGANCFYRHPLVRSVAYSDGVKDLADTGCHWLLDILATELPEVFRKNAEVSNRAIITMKVAKGKVNIAAEFAEDEAAAWAKHGIWTDLPDGDWSLFMADEYEGPTRYRIILLTEY